MMTTKEAKYFNERIDRKIAEIFATLTNEQRETLKAQRFAKQYLQLINGQQFLPQGVFREFLESIDFSAAKELHDSLDQVREKLDEALDVADKVSDMDSLHYTDGSGEKYPLYIYIGEDDEAFNTVDKTSQEGLWQGITAILDAKRYGPIQLVNLAVLHSRGSECGYLYFRKKQIKTVTIIREYLWTVDGYYMRMLESLDGTETVTNDWEWHDIDDKLVSLQEQIDALSGGGEISKEVIAVDYYDDLLLIEDKQEEVLYLVTAQNKLYRYDGDEDDFVEIASDGVDNTIAVSNLDALLDMTFDEAGVWSVAVLSQRGTSWYTLTVTKSKGPNRIAKPSTVKYIPILSCKQGWAAIDETSIGTPTTLTVYFDDLGETKYLLFDKDENAWYEEGNSVYYLANDITKGSIVVSKMVGLQVGTVNSYQEGTVTTKKSWGWHYYSYEGHTHIENGTYEELKALAASGKLKAGTHYRMTDFVTTAVDEDNRVRSAGHAFDLILLATSETQFDKHARAVLHAGDTYFADCDLAAWEVNYDINNDTTKYKWADEANGKGVITYMKDEHGNVCHYDFKNIQFKRWAITDISSSSLTADALSILKSIYCYSQNGGRCFATKDVYGGWVPQDVNGAEYTIDEDTSAWYYTFHGLHSSDGETIDGHYDMSVKQYKLTDGCVENMEENGGGGDTQDLCKDNYIKPAYNEYFLDDEYYTGRQVLNDIVFLNGLSYCYYNKEDEYWEYQTSSCYANKFGLECKNSTFGNNCYRNTFGNYCNSNTFGNSCYSNTFGNSCYYNTFGNYCNSNTFGNDCSSNTFGNYCYYNTFGNNCNSNTFGNDCSSNTFGNNCNSNTFGNNCNSNTFGNYCNSNTFGNYCNSNTFGNNCYRNTFGNSCYYNTFGNYCYYNTFGNYIRYLTVFEEVQYVSVTGGSSSTTYVQNGQILNGTQGTSSSNKLTITFTANKKATQIAGLNSSNVLKIWTPADLV